LAGVLSGLAWGPTNGMLQPDRLNNWGERVSELDAMVKASRVGWTRSGAEASWQFVGESRGWVALRKASIEAESLVDWRKMGSIWN
jgi:hypothetical protein